MCACRLLKVTVQQGELSFIDLSDAQWRGFRENIPILLVLLFVSALLLRLTRLFFFKDGQGKRNQAILHVFHALLGMGMALYLHGPVGFGLVLALSVLSFLLTRTTAHLKVLGLVSVWALSLALLFLKEAPILQWFLSPSLVRLLLTRGATHPWTFSANFLVLRLLSFHFDVRWSRLHRQEHFLPKPPRAPRR